MSCSGHCPVTRYEIEHRVLVKPTITDACRVGDILPSIKKNLEDDYPDQEAVCGEGCDCLELPGQNPPPSAWSPWYRLQRTFEVPETKCVIFYQVAYRYRTRLFDRNCVLGGLEGAIVVPGDPPDEWEPPEGEGWKPDEDE